MTPALGNKFAKKSYPLIERVMNGVNWKHVGNDIEDYGSSPYAFFYGNDGEMDSGVNYRDAQT